MVWSLVAASFLLSGLPFLIAAVSRRFDPFEPIYIFAFSYAILFAVRPAFDLARGLPLWVGYSVDPGYVSAIGLGLLGCLGFYAGYFFGPAADIGRRIPTLRGTWVAPSLYLFIAFATALALFLFAIFVAESGGVAFLIALLQGRNAVSEAAIVGGPGYLYSAPLWLTSLAVLLLALSSRANKVQITFGFLLLLISQIAAIGLGDRSWTLPAIAAVLMLWYLVRDRRPSIGLIVLGLAVLFVVGITLPRQYRDPVFRGSTLGQTLATTLSDPSAAVTDFFQGGDTAMVDNLAVEVQFVPSTIPHQLGTTYVAELTRAIPHDVWPDKPISSDKQLMKTIWPVFDMGGVGFAFSVFGEPYLNFGLAGTIVFGALFGVFWRALYVWFIKHRRNRTTMALYALTWPFLPVYVRGGIGVDYHRELIYLLPLVCALIICQVRSSRWPIRRAMSIPAVPNEGRWFPVVRDPVS
jgi:oligosaccharide repeat unit polymerase